MNAFLDAVTGVEWWYPVVAWGLLIASIARSLLTVGGLSRLPSRAAWLPLAVGGVAAIPIAGLPIGRWLHGFTGDFSIPLVALLFDDVVSPMLHRPLLDRPARRAGCWFGLIAAALLYPLALGIGPFDPYVLGWRSPGAAALAAGSGAALIASGNRFGGALIAAGIAWQAGILESDNAWDYLVDPFYAIIAAATALGDVVRGIASRRRAARIAVVAILATGIMPVSHAADSPPDEQQLAGQWESTAAVLERQSTREGSEELAALIRGWELPAAPDRIAVVDIPSRLHVPEWVDTPAKRQVWDDFVAARRHRAEGLFALALEAARSHAAGHGLTQRSCDAVRLLGRTLREDPEHPRARKAGGWTKRGDDWVWPNVARRIDKGETWSDEFGWLPRSRIDRYRAGERYDRGRWIRADDAVGPRPLERGLTFASDHWQIRSTAPLEDAAALARELEEARIIWLQVFGGFQSEPSELERQFEGRSPLPPRDPFAAVLTATRQQYITELEKLEPLAGRTLGIYWTPTRTGWFFVGAERTPTTVHHEATHQLFGEMRKTSPLVGERCGFWAVEAAACFMESLERTSFGWLLGGLDSGRVPAARQRLLEDNFYVSLSELTSLGRREFQSDERLPRIYSQISGLADFFMTGQRGRHREAFVEYLVRVYSGTADSDTLARLCRTDYATLDEEYRRHICR